MNKPLSYSSYSLYHICPKKYEYEKIQFLQPEVIPYHLIFGSCIDNCLNAALEGHPDPIHFASITLGRLFTEQYTIKRKEIWSDINEFLTKFPILCVTEELRTIGWKGEKIEELADYLLSKIENNEYMSENQKTALNLIIFYTAREKAKNIISLFYKHVLPIIEEVISVQRQTKRGIIDFEAKLKGYDDVVVLDNKTASRPYKLDSVEYSIQLAGYGAHTGAYVVFNKNNNKAKPQIIIQKIPEHNRNLVEDAYKDTEELIRTNIFPRNLNSCGKQYGQPCPYLNLCWKNTQDGLIKKEIK
jgi:hypothetical protein